MLSYEIRTDNKITTANNRLITPQEANAITIEFVEDVLSGEEKSDKGI
jgi:hypothetical protein